MGQKINPTGFRLGVNRTSDSRWFADKTYATLVHQDIALRKYIFEHLKQALVSQVIIERPTKKPKISIRAGRPGVVIGKKGTDIEKLKAALSKIAGDEVMLNIIEVRKPDMVARLVAENIASQLERRVSYRRAVKKAIQSAMRAGAEGIRVNVSGRIGGAEIARMEWYREGRVPLHTLRADIDYGVATAFTTYGTCGVKVWIYKGEIMAHDSMAQDKKVSENLQSR